MHLCVRQSCPTLCNPMGYSPPGSSVHAILQARILEWVAMSSSKGPSQPRDQTSVPCVFYIARRFLTTSATWEALKCRTNPQKDVLVTQSCPILCDPVDCSPPGSSVHGIPQATILE